MITISRIGRFNIGFAEGPAVSAKVIDDEVHVLVVVMRDD